MMFIYLDIIFMRVIVEIVFLVDYVLMGEEFLLNLSGFFFSRLVSVIIEINVGMYFS